MLHFTKTKLGNDPPSITIRAWQIAVYESEKREFQLTWGNLRTGS